MIKFCEHCQKQYDESMKKCPDCAKKLKPRYTPEELAEFEKQNDDMTVINTMLM